MPDEHRQKAQASIAAHMQDWDGSTAFDAAQGYHNGETEYYSDASQELSEDNDELPDDLVSEDMRRLESSFVGISKRFRLINRIGEGTFSTVYKAEDLLHDHYINDWEYDDIDANPHKRRRLGDNRNQQASARSKRKDRPHYVALKKIYVTSSPARIINELELLYDLRGSRSVCPIITAFRHQDQVVAVLPYFAHTDFRIQYRTFLVEDMRHYFSSLFNALDYVHGKHIIHRDIKPTNFLYNPVLKRGVLVDFGLAEREYLSLEPCLCSEAGMDRRYKIRNSLYSLNGSKLATGYPKNDPRPSRRANRAGTRGFRAPEVLLKCTSQTTKIDIWSAGVILLTLLGRRFPFFHSIDDVDALIEMASIVGQRRMKSVASLHGQVFETTIPTIGERGYTWEKIVKWSSCVDSLTGSEKQGVRLLSRLMELDPHRRISAGEALDDEFFTDPDPDDLAWGGETTKEDGDKAEASKQGDNAANDGTVDGDVDGVDEVQLVQ